MEVKNMDDYSRKLNESVEAPTSGVYRYELIPDKNANSGFYIDIWYQFAMGMSNEQLLEHFEDAVYLEEGDRIILDELGLIKVRKKKVALKLVVNNG